MATAAPSWLTEDVVKTAASNSAVQNVAMTVTKKGMQNASIFFIVLFFSYSFLYAFVFISRNK